AQLSGEGRAAVLHLPQGVTAKPPTVTPAKAGVQGALDSRFCGNDDKSLTLWIAAERLPQFQAVWPDAQPDPPISAPEPHANREWSREEALIEILRGRLEGLGPVTEAALAAPLGIEPAEISAALTALETEGFAMRGRFTPGAEAEE